MQRNEDILYIDFQGWPVYKMNLREIIESLIFKHENGVYSIDDNDPKLDLYPVILEEDGMGYGVNPRYVNEVSIFDDRIQMFADSQDENIDEKIKAD